MATRWRVRKLAEAKGMNISQLAEASGMAYSSVLDYWHNRGRRIDLLNVERLCKALDCTPADLFEYLPDVTIDDESIEDLALESAFHSRL
jgi:putative transcriptional regulator